jgi:hypothetical protein
VRSGACYSPVDCPGCSRVCADCRLDERKCQQRYDTKRLPGRRRGRGAAQSHAVIHARGRSDHARLFSDNEHSCCHIHRHGSQFDDQLCRRHGGSGVRRRRGRRQPGCSRSVEQRRGLERRRPVCFRLAQWLRQWDQFRRVPAERRFRDCRVLYRHRPGLRPRLIAASPASCQIRRAADGDRDAGPIARELRDRRPGNCR